MSRIDWRKTAMRRRFDSFLDLFFEEEDKVASKLKNIQMLRLQSKSMEEAGKPENESKSDDLMNAL